MPPSTTRSRRPSPTSSSSGSDDADAAPLLSPALSRRGGGAGSRPPGTPTPHDRFRAAVRKIIQLNALSSLRAAPDEAGAEPGVDPRRPGAAAAYGHVRTPCIVEVCDYSSVAETVRRMNNDEFVAWLANERRSKRESWAKVRWINVAGVSWDVISALAIKYDLHPLAIEDVLHQPRSGLLSKADYYTRHLFLRVLSHTLARPGEPPSDPHLPPRGTASPSAHTPAHSDSESESEGDTDSEARREEVHTAAYNHQHFRLPRQGSLASSATAVPGSPRANGGYQALPFADGATDAPADHRDAPAHGHGHEKHRARAKRARTKARHAAAIAQLKETAVPVKIAPLCIFLLRDGTVITIGRSPSLAFTAPIRARLAHADTALRTSADAALLVHALLDLLVDRIFDVVDEYHTRILALEHAVLLRPNMRAVRAAHVLQADLARHRRTLEPLRTVVHGLRRHDAERAGASAGPGHDTGGYMSHKARIYLADVVDHLEYILASVEMFAGTTESLMDYTFNMASNNMNEKMERLTLVTIIFLPLTLLTGYFGMNFVRFGMIEQHSDLFFWKLGIPLCLFITAMFMWSDIVDAVDLVRKRLHSAERKLVGKKRPRRRTTHDWFS